MTPIVIIRPEPGATQTLQDAREAGLPVNRFPLFAISPVSWEPIDPSQADALLLGSANAVRHAGPDLARYAGLPVHAVGRSTAEAARAAGLRIEAIGTGGLQPVIDRVIGPIRFLRLAGRHHVPLDTSRAVSVVERIVYESTARTIPEDLEALLREGVVILLHSAAAAEHLRSECLRLDIDLAANSLAALGPRIAEAAGEGWRAVRYTPQPKASDLLALAADMCH